MSLSGHGLIFRRGVVVPESGGDGGRDVDSSVVFRPLIVVSADFGERKSISDILLSSRMMSVVRISASC